MNKTLHALFEELYQDYLPMVRQISLGYVRGNKALAHDLAQEVFVNVWRSLAKFNENSSHKTWIYRITVNTCLKNIRDAKDEYLSDSNVEELSVQAPQSDHSNDLYTAIGKLTELDRLIVMMVLDEMEYGEISHILGIKEGALRVRIHRAKKQLQELLTHD